MDKKYIFCPNQKCKFFQMTGTGKKSGLNILVLHAHWNNRGDEAAIRAMLDSLKVSLPVKHIVIMLMVKSDIFFDEQVEIIEAYPCGSKLIYLDALLTILTIGKLSLTNCGKRFLDAVNNADIVIHAPGGPSIGDIYGGKLGDLPYLYRLLMVKLFKKKPLFFYAPSMGPFLKKRFNWLRKLLLKHADGIAVRDIISARYLRQLLDIDIHVTVDSAFQNDIPESYLNAYPHILPLWSQLQKVKYIGMIITDLKWHPSYKQNPEVGKSLVMSMLEMAKFLIRKGYKILLIPQLFGGWSDYGLLEKVATVDTQDINILPPDVDAYAQQLVISKLFCVISARYHPIIFAVKSCVPIIGIYYEHKTKGFLESLGFEKFGIDVREVTIDKLISTFKVIESEYNELIIQLQTISNRLRNQAKEITKTLLRL